MYFFNNLVLSLLQYEMKKYYMFLPIQKDLTTS